MTLPGVMRCVHLSGERKAPLTFSKSARLPLDGVSAAVEMELLQGNVNLSACCGSALLVWQKTHNVTQTPLTA